MLKKFQVLSFAVMVIMSANAQVNKNVKADRPPLVVGLVVDQMRWDFLYRYENHYGNGGFKRMMNEGYNFNNVMINYVPTVTAIGHTSVYTGSVPSIHGIAGNNWLDKETGESIYCTTDSSVKGVGSSSEKIGAHSPKNLWSTTITDQLGMSNNFRSKVVGISLKDRASILPAGHNPTGAFWFDEGTGNFVTSTYYMNDLPEWLKKFNAQNLGKQLVSNGWETLKPIAQYIESTGDNMPWEGQLGTASTPTFPYRNLSSDYDDKKGVIRTTPFGNTLTLKAAEAAIDGYNMGKNSDTDFLVVNLASTDYVGHTFGPNSIEVQDTYIRLDKDLETFFNKLDKQVGKNNYVVFLTADHGAANAEGYMRANKMMTGFFDDGLKKNLEAELKQKFANDKLILGVENYQIYLNHKVIGENNLDVKGIKDYLIEKLNKDERVLYAVDLKNIGTSPVPEPIKSRVINGYNWQRSGDIQIVSHDGMLPSYSKKGTTHGVWNSYDSHIPLLFFGKGIKNGKSVKPYHMTDIAPTVAQILKIENPSGNIGEPIAELFD